MRRQRAGGRAYLRAAILLAAGLSQGTIGRAADSPGMAMFREAHKLTETAKTDQELSAIIGLCEQGMKEQVAEPEAKYAANLLSWSYNRRGEVRADAGQDEAALADFEESVKLDDTRWNAYHNRGVSYGLMGKYAEALADFDKTLQLKPNYAKGYYNRGEVKFKQGNVAGAMEDYGRTLRLAPNDSSAYNSRGFAFYSQGNYRNAIADFTSAIRLNANNAEALANRGDAYADQGMFPQAVLDFQAAVRADPKFGRAYVSAAWIRATCPSPQIRNPDLALQSAKRAMELDGDQDYRYLDALAAAQANAGQFTEAQESIAKAIALAAAEGIDAKLVARLEGRQKLYAENQPYRDVAPGSPQPRQARTQR